MMKNLIFIMLLGGFAFSFINSNSEGEIIKEVLIHKKFHMTNPSAQLSSNQIMLSKPDEGIINKVYNCTLTVKNTANIILQDRPAGSEVFVLFDRELVTALDICHKHDGVIIECGEAL